MNSNLDNPNDRPARTGVSRRSVIRAAAWSTPVIVASVATPALAASTVLPTVLTATFGRIMYTLEPSATLAAGTVTVSVLDTTGPIANATVTVAITAPDEGEAVPGSEETPAGAPDAVSAPSARFSNGTTMYSGATNASGVLALPAITAAEWPGVLKLTASAKVGTKTVVATPAALRVSRNYALQSWGYNAYGLAGAGSATGSFNVPMGVVLPPSMVDFSIGTSSGYTQFAVDSATGNVWGWGYGAYLLPGGKSSNVPVNLGFSDAVDVVSCYYQAFVLRSDGTVWGWGHRGHGLMGDGGSSAGVQSSPVKVAFPAAAGKIVKVVAGIYTAYALDINGAVWAWGDNTYYSRGDGKGQAITAIPTRVTLPAGARAIDVSAHYYGGHAVLETGRVYGWGGGSWNMLGVPAVNRPVADVVPAVLGAKKIYSNWYNTAVILDDDSVRIWGTGDYYGSGRGVNGNAPGVWNTGLRDIKEIAFTRYSGIALTNSGTLYGWGWNGLGQNGNGATGGSITTPTRIQTLNNIAAIGSSVYGFYAAQRRA